MAGPAPAKDGPRVNEDIRARTIFLIGDDGHKFGALGIDEARAVAEERGFDLVEVSPEAEPPVVKLMDYGKFKFESIKKEKDGRRKHNVIKVKEMKLRPKIGEHDFQTKFHAVRSFLEEGDKVKLTIMFRGREMVHQDIGKKLLDRMALELKTISTVERMPLLEGRNMIMILAPAGAAAAQAQAAPPPTQVRKS